jgi:hypothetical protein
MASPDQLMKKSVVSLNDLMIDYSVETGSLNKATQVGNILNIILNKREILVVGGDFVVVYATSFVESHKM